MTTIQQSIEVRVPAEAAFNQLMQFENYSQFMEDVESVQKIDDTHLHWTTRMANRPVEWDAEIIEEEAGRSVAWHNTSGPTNSGKVEVTPLGPQATQVSITLHSEPQQVPGSMADFTEEDMAARLKQDMMRLRDFIEGGQIATPTGTQSMQKADGQLRPGGASQSHLSEQAEQSQHAQQPVHQHAAPASVTVGAAGGTDASAGAKLSGSRGGPGGPSLRESGYGTGVPGTPGGMMQGDQISPAAGANVAGGTGLGSAASADDTRTGTGTTSGSGTSLTGGGQSGARDAGIGGSGSSSR
jgi:hypothetical protein